MKQLISFAFISFTFFSVSAQFYLEKSTSFQEKAYSDEYMTATVDGKVVIQKLLYPKADPNTYIDISIYSPALEELQSFSYSYAGNFKHLGSFEDNGKVVSLYKDHVSNFKIFQINVNSLEVSVTEGTQPLPYFKEIQLQYKDKAFFYSTESKKTPQLISVDLNGQIKQYPIAIRGYDVKTLKVFDFQLDSAGTSFLWSSMVKTSKKTEAVIFRTSVLGEVLDVYHLKMPEGRRIFDMKTYFSNGQLAVGGVYSDAFPLLAEGMFYGVYQEGFQLNYELLEDMPLPPAGFYPRRKKTNKVGKDQTGFEVQLQPIFYSNGLVFYFNFIDPEYNYNSQLIGHTIPSVTVTKFKGTVKIWQEGIHFDVLIKPPLRQDAVKYQLENDSIFQIYLLGDFSIASAEFDNNGLAYGYKEYSVVNSDFKGWDQSKPGFGVYYATGESYKPGKEIVDKEIVSIQFLGKTYESVMAEIGSSVASVTSETNPCYDKEYINKLLGAKLQAFSEQDAAMQALMEKKITHLAKINGWDANQEAEYSLKLISTPEYTRLYNAKLGRSQRFLNQLTSLMDESKDMCEVAELINNYLERGIETNKKEWELVMADLDRDLGDELQNIKMKHELSEAELQIVGEYIDLDDEAYGIVFQKDGNVFDIVNGYKTNARTWKVEDGKLCFMSICLDYSYQDATLSYSVFGEAVRYKKVN